jgi:hypothetical protein
MSDSLSSKLADGETADLGRTFFNDLVERLNDAERPGPLDVSQSAGEAKVHPDSAGNYALIPSEVTLKDATDWGGMGSSRVKIEWTLTGGPGHLDAGNGPTASATTDPGASVSWDWHHDSETSDPYYDNNVTRAWDAMPGGQALPGAAEIQVTGKVLTDPANGTYTAVGSVRREIQVSRAYDPDRVPGTRIRLRASQEIAYLDGDGTAGALLFDDSTFRDAATAVNRTVTARFEGQPEGEGVALQDRGDAPGETGNIDGTNDLLSESDWREIGVSAQAAGELTVTAEYDVTTGNGTETHVTKRRIEVVPTPDPAMESTTDPQPPATELVPTKGRAEVHLGEPVKLTGAAETGSFFDGSLELSWTDERAAEVARRLDLDDLQVRETVTGGDSVPIEQKQVELLNRAGTLLNAALGQATSRGLSVYEITLDTDYSAPEIGPKSVIRAGGAVFRVQSVIDEQTVQAVGIKPPGWSAPETGRVTGNGKWFVVEMEAGYGTAGEPSFPRRTSRFSDVVDPIAGPGRAGLTLPEAEPEHVTDRWHARYRVHARWENGATVSTDWTDWARAEPVPEGPPSVSLSTKGEMQEVKIEGSGPVYGVHGWRDPEKVPDGAPDSAGRALSGGRVPPKILTHPPVHHESGSVYVLEGYLRTEAGSCQSSVQRAVSREVSPTGLPVVSTDSDQPPQDVEVPAMDGAILEGPSRKWISVSGSWAPVGAGPARIRVTSAQVITNGTPEGSTVQSSPTQWTGSAEFPPTNQVSVRFIVEGGVDSAQPVNIPAGTINFQKEEGIVNIEFGMQPSFHGDSMRFVVRLVPSGGAAEEKIVEYVLDDSSATNLGGPEVYSVSATGKEGTTADDGFPKNPSPDVWTVEHSDAWTGLTANLLLKNVSSVVGIRRTDGTDYESATFLDHMPPYINITSSSTDATFEVDIKNASGTTDTYTLDVIKV